SISKQNEVASELTLKSRGFAFNLDCWRSRSLLNMVNIAFQRAVASVKQQADGRTSKSGRRRAQKVNHIEDLDADEISLTDQLFLVRVESLRIVLTPMVVTGGKPALTATRWEVRKALLSLCSSVPTKFEAEVNQSCARVWVSFKERNAAKNLARKLQGVTVNISGTKLHTTVQEASENGGLCEGSDWETALLGRVYKDNLRAEAFSRLPPGWRPDTIVLRGIPANWLGEGGRVAEGTSPEALVEAMSRLGHVLRVDIAPSTSTNTNTNTNTAATSKSLGQPQPAQGGPGDLSIESILADMGPPGSGKYGS
ncbi:unnamed protein product, partial [Discosporangium mesarthrocarpum]